MEEVIISGQMPVLALRGLVVYPMQTVHFDVAREKSVKAIERAMDHDQVLCLIPQISTRSLLRDPLPVFVQISLSQEHLLRTHHLTGSPDPPP